MTATAGGARLHRLAWLSVAAAVVTIALKGAAWLVTGSVGFLSDAAESGVNLVAAAMAVVVLRVADAPPDDEHHYGHEKAEYFSAGIEGGMIFLAALVIAVTATDRLLDPQPLTDVGIGVAVSLVASVLNLAVALVLLRTARAHASPALEAGGHHLITDVVTSVGVVVGVGLASATGYERLDALVALAVAANITVMGLRLVHRSAGGLMDRALPEPELAAIRAVLDEVEATSGAQFHALRTRRAGRRSFVSLHILVPGSWTVQQGHDLAERVEERLAALAAQRTVFTHVEPVEDPASFADTRLDRA